MYQKNDGTKNYSNSMLRLDNCYVGPHKYLSEEAEYIRSIKWNTIEAKMLGVTIGANIKGIDLRKKINNEQLYELKKAISLYKVIVIDGFEITQKQHAEFSECLGPVMEHPFIPSSGNEKIISFIRDKNSGGYENIWHNDLTWIKNPGMYALLNCINIPEYGGDTLFADMYAAYEMLDDEIKNCLNGLEASHDFLLSFGSFFSNEQMMEMQKKYPIVKHPVFPTHPITNKKFVYINKNFTSKINTIDEKKSIYLIDHLSSLASTPEIQYRHKWKYPQMVIWDNFSVQHYAPSDYWPYNRHVDRATVSGPKFNR
jgi:taurine dioxygenase